MGGAVPVELLDQHDKQFIARLLLRELKRLAGIYMQDANPPEAEPVAMLRGMLCF